MNVRIAGLCAVLIASLAGSARADDILDAETAGEVKECAEKVRSCANGEVRDAWNVMRETCKELRGCKRECRETKRDAVREARRKDGECFDECKAKGRNDRRCKRVCKREARQDKRACVRECRDEFGDDCRKKRLAFFGKLAKRAYQCVVATKDACLAPFNEGEENQEE